MDIEEFYRIVGDMRDAQKAPHRSESHRYLVETMEVMVDAELLRHKREKTKNRES